MQNELQNEEEEDDDETCSVQSNSLLSKYRCPKKNFT